MPPDNATAKSAPRGDVKNAALISLKGEQERTLPTGVLTSANDPKRT